MPRQKPKTRPARKICPACNGTGTVPEQKPKSGRKRCPTCNGRQWVPA